MRKKVWGILLTAAMLATSVPVASTAWAAEDSFTDGAALISQTEEGDLTGETEDFQDEQTLEENVTEFSADPEEEITDAGGVTDELESAESEVKKLEIGKTYYIMSDIQPDFWADSYKFYVNVDCPGPGRVKILLNDCTTKYMQCSDGLYYTGEDSAETYWHTVDAGTLQYYFCTDPNQNNVKINPEATLTVKFESIEDYNGEQPGSNSFDTATPMQLNTEYEGSITNEDTAYDYYKFVMEEPGVIGISGLEYPFYAEIDKEDKNGNTTLLANTHGVTINNKNYCRTRQRMEAGTYYIVVKSATYSGEYGEYTIKVDAAYESAEDYEQENNNVKSQANVKNLNHWYTGNLNTMYDVDCFKFALADRSVVSIEFRVPRQIQSEIFKVSLCDSSMNEIASANNTSDPYLTFGNGIYDPGTYYIHVTAGRNYDKYGDKYCEYDYSFNFNQMKYIPVSGISIPSSANVKLNGKTSLNPAVVPDNAYNKELKWSTSDPCIATVDEDGTVTGKRIGTVLITAEATDDSGVKATCEVTVYTVKVSKISLSSNQKKVKPGESFFLKATVNPSDAYDKSVKWTSSNEEVATVDWWTGCVYANKVGTAVITATSTDGSNVSASCMVHVDNVKVFGIVLSDTVKNVSSKTQFTLKTTIAPADAYNKKLKWSSSNPDVAYVNQNGDVIADESGSAVITATTTDGSNLSASCVVHVTNKVTYQLNGGKNNSANPTIINGSRIILKNPTRAGYVFKGWYEYGYRITEIQAGYNYHTLNLVAKWEKVTVGKPVITSFYNRSGKKAVLKYKGVSKASGYQIVYSTNKKLKKKCTTITTKSKNYTLKKLAKRKTYYVKVRAYRIDSTGKKIYGRYTGVRKVRINK